MFYITILSEEFTILRISNVLSFLQYHSSFALQDGGGGEGKYAKDSV